MSTRPDLVTSNVWKSVQQDDEHGKPPAGFPADTRWFRPIVPAGTAFDVHKRPFEASGRIRLDAAQLQEIRRRAPYARSIVLAAVHARHGQTPDLDVLRREFGEAPAYDVKLAWQLAAAAYFRPDEYLSILKSIAPMDAGALVDMSSYLADLGRIRDAVRAAEEYIGSAPTEVGLSNSVRWLVRHYHDTRQAAKAAALADRAGATYSYWGLVTRADLHDWRGEIAEAEALYRKAAERYGGSNELIAFYLRRQYPAERLAPLLAAVFPEGIQRVALSSFTGPPVDGVVFTLVGKTGERNGMRVDDVVVAVDGIRVRTFDQYRVARNASSAPDMRLIVWRRGAYREVVARLRHSWPVSNLMTYARPGPPPAEAAASSNR